MDRTSSRAGLQTWLWAPIDASPIHIFRKLFGAVVLVQVVRLFRDDMLSFYFIDPEAHFKYQGFGWVPVLSPPMLHAQYVIMGLASIMFATGCFSCAASLLLLIMYLLFFLSDRALYNNHYYLAILIIFIFLIIDTNWAVSRLVSRLHQKNRSKSGSEKQCDRLFSCTLQSSPTQKLASQSVCPRWCLLALMFQIWCVYFYGALAKLNWDWLRAYPTRGWLQNAFELAVLEVFGDGARPIQNHPLPLGCAYIMCYSGIIVDGFIAFAIARICTSPSLGVAIATPSRCDIFIKRLMILVWVAFHTLNWLLFNIGVFPYMMLSVLVLFVDLRGAPYVGRVVALLSHDALDPSLVFSQNCCPRNVSGSQQRAPSGLRLVATDRNCKLSPHPTGASSASSASSPSSPLSPHTVRIYWRLVVTGFLGVYCLVQLVVPLRHVIYERPGRHVSWTGKADMFSWRMMLTSKQCRGHFQVEANANVLALYSSHEELGISDRQWSRMMSDAEHIRQMAWFLKEDQTKVQRGAEVQVFASVWCSLNGSKEQPFVRDDIDIASLDAMGIIDAIVLDQTQFP